MAKIVWTARARNDLLRLRSFLAAQNAEASNRAIIVIRTALQTLREQPQSGTIVEWLPDGYREWYIRFGGSGYVVLYRYLGEEIVIQAIRHGRESGYKAE
jgi:plasmid stabilization system protein ParE